MGVMKQRRAALAIPILALVALGSLTPTLAQGPPPAGLLTPAVASALDAAARDAVAVGDVPGTVVVVGQGDRVMYRHATGSRALVPAVESMSPDTVFDVASLTKVVATMPAILALWEEGRIDLDALLGRYLKEFSTPAFREVTIRRLLTHSSGLSDLPRREAMVRGFPEAAALQAKAGLAAAPGSTFVYSDIGFILLGEVVRRVSGEPLDRYVQKRFYGPLGMRSTTFRPPAAWRPRIAPTEKIDAGPPLRGVVHDGNARLLSGVAGHAGLFSTADDLSRFSRMILDGGTLDGHRYLKESTVRAMFTPHVIGETTRGLGWDMSSTYSRTLGSFFPEGSAGHTGFTGPSMWLDPASRQYVIILTNRVHPSGKGSVVELRRRISAAVGPDPAPRGEPPAIAPSADGGAPVAAPALGRTLTGLDRLTAENFARLAGRSVGLVTNQTGIDARGRRGIDLLAAAPGVKLRAIFSPEHGLDGKVDANVPHGRDAATGLPVWSLYGPTRRPSPEMLAGIDTIVFDIQDVGARYYTRRSCTCWRRRGAEASPSWCSTGRIPSPVASSKVP
jgi:CubicO group peptidase (beta-lactamase class C family)